MALQSKWVVFDAEGDGLTPTKFYCVCYKDYEGNEGVLTEYGAIRDFFSRYEVYVGHKIRSWDIPSLQRVVSIPKLDRVIDTLGLSWYLQPQRKRHGLEYYGEDYGISKPVITDWYNLSLEDYIHRCQRDVEINHRLFGDQLRYLSKLYPDGESLWRFLKYLDFKMVSAQMAEESRWKLDVGKTELLLKELGELRDSKESELSLRMPEVPVVTLRHPPKRQYKADGELSLLGYRWKELLEERGLPEGHEEPVEVITGYTPGNPASHQQLKDWLYFLGWKPQTFKHKRNKLTGETKEIPQINKEHGEGICESIKDLYDEEPSLELLDGLSILNHRISILSGFLRDRDADGYLRARVQGLTNTLRFKHAEIVNLPKADDKVKYGSDIRSCLVAPDGYELAGSDMSGLEDRLKQHFIFPLDPDYVATLNRDDYDPHLDIAVLAGGLDKEDAEWYVHVNGLPDEDKRKLSLEDLNQLKRIKSIRSIFKNGNYACQYGAGIPRLMLTCGIDREAAAKLHGAYWKRNWAIKAVAERQRVQTLSSPDGNGGQNEQMWLFNPISNFWYSLRYEKDIFSTLVQGSGAYCFDTYLNLVLAERPQVTGQFHDEFILTVKKGYREEITTFLKSKIKEVNDYLKLNRDLDIGVEFGENYAEIH